MASIFTKILKREIPSKILHEDEHCAAIADINPQAPVHFLVFPRQELRSVDHGTPAEQQLLGHLLLVAAKVARDQGLSENGYRLVINTGKNGGQTVDHIHVHVLGGRQMSWPPG
jgi:histidine triad (HIT) family protein